MTLNLATVIVTVIFGLPALVIAAREIRRINERGPRQRTFLDRKGHPIVG